MSYAADGPLEPVFVDEVRQEFLPDVMGYRILLTEWTDGQYTLNIYKPLSPYDEEVLEDGICLSRHKAWQHSNFAGNKTIKTSL